MPARTGLQYITCKLDLLSYCCSQLLKITMYRLFKDLESEVDLKILFAVLKPYYSRVLVKFQ